MPEPICIAPNTPNRIRTKPIGVVRIFRQFDLDTPKAENDIFILEASDGSWKQVVNASSLTEVMEDWVEIQFDGVPKGITLNLIHDPNEELEDAHVIFNEYTYADLMDESKGQIQLQEDPAEGDA